MADSFRVGIGDVPAVPGLGPDQGWVGRPSSSSSMPPGQAEHQWRTVWQAFLSGIPLGRPQSAEDIGHACAFLASDAAANITGEALNVSGGQQMH
jgi:NAD(P)-dependent dehydrogenase (short-subunit alcohol dehydrogenase family)